MQVSRFYKNNHFICEWNVAVYTVAVVSSCCRQHSYAKMIITFMLLNKKVLSGRRSFSHRVKYKGFATRSVCFGLLNTCISGVLECRIGLNLSFCARVKTGLFTLARNIILLTAIQIKSSVF